LFPWFPIDQRSKIAVSEGGKFWVSLSFEHWWVCHCPSFSELRKRTESWVVLR
jgi:hypothetical protein